MMRKAVQIACVVGAAVSAAALSAAHAAPQSAPPTVPPGVTLVEVMRELVLSQPQFLWVRIGDAQGRTLLTSAADKPGVSNCVDACAQEFPPFIAPSGAVAFGDWSLIKRRDGSLQWAYQAQPLYTWTKETVPGEVAVNVGGKETEGNKLAENEVRVGDLLPPGGWAVARLTPAASMMLPSGIDAKLVGSAAGVVLTNHQGFTLYAFEGEARADQQTCASQGCRYDWIPVAAPAFAHPVGDFSIVERADGSSQWAYRKKPLYRYSGDLLPGDTLGAAVNPKWTVAAVSRNFEPADVAVGRTEAYGDTLTLKGMTLYTGVLSAKRWGGRNTRDGFRNTWSRGMALGTAACGDDKCLADWKPFIAPTDAQPHDFWQVYDRPDGTKQWAYKGYAVWLHAKDEKPGDHRGQLTFDYGKLGGGEKDLERMWFLDKTGGDRAYGGAGIYWALARP